MICLIVKFPNLRPISLRPELEHFQILNYHVACSQSHNSTIPTTPAGLRACGIVIVLVGLRDCVLAGMWDCENYEYEPHFHARSVVYTYAHICFSPTLGVGLLNAKFNSSPRPLARISSPRPGYPSLIPGVPRVSLECATRACSWSAQPAQSVPAPEFPWSAQQCPTLECFGVASPRVSLEVPNRRVSLPREGGDARSQHNVLKCMLLDINIVTYLHLSNTKSNTGE